VKSMICQAQDKGITQFVAILAALWVLLATGCSPNLTAEDRRADVGFLARWAKDYSPFVQLNEKHKGLPGCEDIQPKYLRLAEQAQSNKEFLHIVFGYFNLIGESGHGYMPMEVQLLAGMLGLAEHPGISATAFCKAMYWSKLLYKESFVHPPFRVVHREGKYFTGNAWRYKGIDVPRGSEIINVNGMTCSSYLDSIQQNTWLRYVAGNVTWITRYLLVIDEGKDFRGWQVDFLIPDRTTRRTFVPKKKGLALPAPRTSYWLKGKRNCVCLELEDDVGYVRVHSFAGFGKFIERDRRKIKKFLERSEGKYAKLIIDIRNNSGGGTYYWAENLVRPFLDHAVTYKQITGIKRKFISDTKQSDLKWLRGGASVYGYETQIEETEVPPGFGAKEWVFYEITRRLEPSNRYDFSGDIYVLINGGTFSAADDFADAIKRIGMATLVGQNTRGGGTAYFNPVIVRLPVSGMMFILEADLLISPDGTFNELVGTKPDIELPACDLPESVTRENLLKDEWIKTIIDDM